MSVYKLGTNLPKKEIYKRLNGYSKLADMLKRLEWIDGEWCPICDGRFEHKPDCELSTLLKESEGLE